MIQNENDAKQQLIGWLRLHGWVEEVSFANSYGLGYHKGRIAWCFNMEEPRGVFYVYYDNGEVEDFNHVIVKE